MTQPTRDPSPAMVAALQSFADLNGKNWKEELSNLWYNGRDYYETHGTELHSVRNELGPTWLFDHCDIKPAPLYASREAAESAARTRSELGGLVTTYKRAGRYFNSAGYDSRWGSSAVARFNAGRQEF